MASLTRLVLVEDHPVVAESVGELLAQQPGLAVVGRATDFPTGIDLTLTHRPDVVLADVMFGHEPLGLEFVRGAELRGSTAPVLFWSSFDEPWFYAAAIAA